MRASDFYIGFVESIRMRASDPENEFCGLSCVKLLLWPLSKTYPVNLCTFHDKASKWFSCSWFFGIEHVVFCRNLYYFFPILNVLCWCLCEINCHDIVLHEFLGFWRFVYLLTTKILTTQVCIVKSGPRKIPVAKYKTAVTPVCWQQSYDSLVLSH